MAAARRCRRFQRRGLLNQRLQGNYNPAHTFRGRRGCIRHFCNQSLLGCLTGRKHVALHAACCVLVMRSFTEFVSVCVFAVVFGAGMHACGARGESGAGSLNVKHSGCTRTHLAFIRRLHVFSSGRHARRMHACTDGMHDACTTHAACTAQHVIYCRHARALCTHASASIHSHVSL